MFFVILFICNLIFCMVLLLYIYTVYSRYYALIIKRLTTLGEKNKLDKPEYVLLGDDKSTKWYPRYIDVVGDDKQVDKLAKKYNRLVTILRVSFIGMLIIMASLPMFY